MTPEVAFQIIQCCPRLKLFDLYNDEYLNSAVEKMLEEVGSCVKLKRIENNRRVRVDSMFDIIQIEEF